MEDNQLYTIILRHDTSTNWMINNPILELGEYGVEDDTHRLKRGDGTSTWSELLYEDFGLEYMVSFANLQGEVTDNEQLTKALDDKVSLDAIKDINYSLVSSISIVDKEGTLATLTRVTKNLKLGSKEESFVDIVSTDNSIQGLWTIGKDGRDILNLKAKSIIEDYKVGFTYKFNELCFYQGKLCRANETLVAEPEMEFDKWIILSSMESEDINFKSGYPDLSAKNVKDAIVQTYEFADKKVTKTTQKNKIYGTDSYGEQKLIDIDDIGRVDSVNGIKPNTDKNVTLYSNNIKYDNQPNSKTVKQELDIRPTSEYVNEGLDKKLDKEISKDIVIDVDVQDLNNIPTIITRKVDTSNYIEDTSAIHLQTKGNLLKSKVEVDSIVIDTDQLETKLIDIEDQINTNKEELDQKITTLEEKDTSLESEINTNKQKINDLTAKNEEFETSLDNMKSQLETSNSNYESLKSQVTTLNETVTANKNETDNKIQDLNDKYTEQQSQLTVLDESVDSNTEQIQSLKEKDTNLEGRLTTVEGNIVNLKTKDDEYRDLIGGLSTSVEEIKLEQVTQDSKIDLNTEAIKKLQSAELDDLTEIKEKNEEQDQRLQAIDNKLPEIDKSLETLTSENKQQDQRIEEISGTVTTLDGKITQEVSDMQEMVNDQTRLIEAINESISSINGSITNIKSKDDEQDKSINGLLESVSSHKQEADGKFTAIDELNQQQEQKLQQLQNEDSNLKNSISALNTEKEEIINKNNDQDQKIQQIETTMQTYDTKNNEQDESIEEINTNIQSIQSTMATDKKSLEDKISKVNTEITSLKETDQTHQQLIEQNTESIETNTTNISNLQTSKLDNTFAQAVDNKLLSDIKLSDVSEFDLINITKDTFDVTTKSTKSETLKITSQNQTVKAKANKDEAGNITSIDLAVNVSIDVNYFLTSEELNNTVGEETVLQKSSIKSISQEDIKVDDIVTDELGTQARVKSLDLETITVVTVTKHTNTVWGTIGGQIDDQLDLKQKLSEKLDKSLSSSLLENISLLKSQEENKLELKTSTLNTEEGSTSQSEKYITSEDLTFEDTEGNINITIPHLSELDNTIQTNQTDLDNKITALDTKLSEADKQINTKLSEKLDKQQGEENNGKHLIVGEDGNVTLSELNIDTGVMSVSSDFNLVDNVDPKQPKILQDESKMDKNFVSTILTNIDVKANEENGILTISSKTTEDDLEKEKSINIVGKSGTKVTSDTQITIDTSELETKITNLTNNKLDKVSKASILYGTDESGNQKEYDLGSMGTVETVNGKPGPNIELKANDIKIGEEDKPLDEYMLKTFNKLNTDVFIGTTLENALSDQLPLYFENSLESGVDLKYSLRRIDGEAIEPETSAVLNITGKQGIKTELVENSLQLSAEAKEITFDKSETELVSTNIEDAIKEISSELGNKASSLEFTTFKQTTEETLGKKLNESSLSKDKFINNISINTLSETEQGVALNYTSKGLLTTEEDTSAITVKITNKKDTGILVTKPNEENIVEIDGTPLKTQITNVEETVSSIETEQDKLSNSVEELKTDKQDVISKYEKGQTYEVGKILYTDRADNITLMGMVKKQFTSNSELDTELDSFKDDVSKGNIFLIGIPLDWDEPKQI